MKVRANKILLIVILCGVILLSACQPTPEETTVIAKDHAEEVVRAAGEEEASEEMLKESDDAEGTISEELIPEYISGGHIETSFCVVEDILGITVNADKQIPNIENYPVALVKTSDFTQEQADELINYFLKGGELVTPFEMTKSDYDDLIIQLKRGHLEDGEYVFNSNDQRIVDIYIEKRESAPDDDNTEPVDHSINGEEGLYARILTNETNLGTIYATTKLFNYQSTYNYLEESYFTAIPQDGEPDKPEKPTVNIEEDEAINIAAMLLTDLEIEGFVKKDIEEVFLYEALDGRGYQSYKTLQAAYRITFVREYGGMLPETTQYSEVNESDEYDYISPFAMEYISIVVDDEGNIHQFVWSNPIEIMGTMAQDVELLPFEDILQCLEKYAKYHWSWMEGLDINYLEYYIDDISLNLYCLPIKDSPYEYMYAPCWIFTYKTRTYYEPERYEKLRELYGNEYVEEIIELGYAEDIHQEHLIFNAIDGGSVSVYPASAVESVIDMDAD